MKVLQICKSYMPETHGGVEEVIKQIIGMGNDGEVQFDVLTVAKRINRPTVSNVDGVTVYQFPCIVDYYSTPVSLSLLLAFRRLVKQYDVLHFHYPWPFAGVLHKSLFGLKKPIVVTYHADALGNKALQWLNGWLCQSLLKACRCLITTSPNISINNEFLENYQEKIKVIPLAIDAQSHPQPIEKQVKLYAGQYGKNFVLFIGQFRKYKGIHVILDAAQKLPDVQFVLAGAGKFFNEAKTIVLAKKLSNVLLLGRVSDLEKDILLTLCGMLILPSISRAEAFGVVLLEAMMKAKPVISTELGTGTSYVNKHLISGLVIEPNNERALADAINYLYENKEKYEELSRNSYDRFLTEFSINKFRASHSLVYNKVIEDISYEERINEI